VYNGKEIDNNGYSTDGKSSDFNMVKILDNSTWERYELPKVYMESEMTGWYSKEVKPLRKGEYQCEFRSTTWPFPIERMCEWTGRSWKENDDGKAEGIVQWRGLKFDPNAPS